MSLVRTEKAQKFQAGLGTQVMRNVMLGNPETCPRAAPHIQGMHVRAQEAYEKFNALKTDKTRTETSKHAAAGRLATQVSDAARAARKEIQLEASAMRTAGGRKVDEALALSPHKGMINDATLAWMRETAKAGKIGEIKKQAAASRDVAAVLYSAPHFLTGLAEGAHSSMKLSVAKQYEPEGFAMIEESVTLDDVDKKLERFERDIHANTYNPTLAAQEETRVEV